MPYVDAGGRGVVSNLSMPVYGPGGVFSGVVSLDVANIMNFRTDSFPALWSRNMELFLVLPEKSPAGGGERLRIIGKKQYDHTGLDWRKPLEAAYLTSNDHALFAELVSDLRNRKSRTAAMEHNGETCVWACGTPWNNGVGLVLVVPRDIIVSDAEAIRKYVEERTRTMLGHLGLVAALVILGVFWIAFRVSRAMAGPVKALSMATREIATGNLGVDIPEIRSQDEIAELAHAIAAMQEDLRTYIVDLTAATAAREKMESELKIARTIQKSFVPKQFPAFPGRRDFDLHAAMEPAREVGGDLYDFLLLDEHRLFFAIGDVSGKGIPAALFMAMCKSLLKGTSHKERDPAQVLGLVNTELCRDNDALMFVTVFCGVLDTRTGAVRYANAGHNPPVLVRAGGGAELLSVHRGLVLGAMEDSVYVNEDMVLSRGDALLLYTDGVTDARNTRMEFYGGQRLLEQAALHGALDMAGAVDALMEDIGLFVGAAPQTDDVTLLWLRWKGKEDGSQET
jgi:sigma-B regulation protein RsbU (phosphoserine phosphatase)